jgi:hypothetical protein
VVLQAVAEDKARGLVPAVCAGEIVTMGFGGTSGPVYIDEVVTDKNDKNGTHWVYVVPVDKYGKAFLRCLVECDQARYTRFLSNREHLQTARHEEVRIKFDSTKDIQ